MKVKKNQLLTEGQKYTEQLTIEKLIEKLIRDAISDRKLVIDKQNKSVEEIEIQRHSLGLIDWLQENKKLRYGDEKQLKKLLTVQNVGRYLQKVNQDKKDWHIEEEAKEAEKKAEANKRKGMYGVPDVIGDPETEIADTGIPEKRTQSLQYKKIHATKKKDLFEDYLTAEGKGLLTNLIKEYSEAKPSDIAYMLYAMYDLTTLVSKSFPTNISKLHRLLTDTFGPIGTRAAFAIQMRSLKEGALPYQKDKISEQVTRIKSLR